MMQQIADELEETTGCLRIVQANPLILDICMAPGGFTMAALKYNPSARVYGFSLPRKSGGHEMLAKANPDQISVVYKDITMFAGEYGIDRKDVPPDHPYRNNFIFDSVIPSDRHFDLVFCDGQVLRTHARHPDFKRDEARRLTCAQLILAFRHIKIGGSLIILLHKVEAWETIRLLHILNQCADIRLFKSKRKHTIRGSFYAIAQNMQPNIIPATAAVVSWQDSWRSATIRRLSDAVTGGATAGLADEKQVNGILSDFGEQLVQLGEPIWDIQKSALGKASFVQKASSADQYLQG